MSKRITAILLSAVMAAVFSVVCSGQDKLPRGVPVEMDKEMFLKRIADYKNNPKAYKITKRIIKRGDKLTLTEAPGGGFAISLIAK